MVEHQRDGLQHDDQRVNDADNPEPNQCQDDVQQKMNANAFVEQIQEGELPSVDVSVDGEAGQLPEFDVDLEEETISVPNVDVSEE